MVIVQMVELDKLIYYLVYIKVLYIQNIFNIHINMIYQEMVILDHLLINLN